MTDTLWELAEELLSNLPDTRDGVAKMLASEGVKGLRDRSNCCPMARWMRNALNVPYVDVDGSDMDVYDEHGNRYNFLVPSALAEFIQAFDLDDAYPELVDPAGETDEEKWGRTNFAYTNF